MRLLTVDWETWSLCADLVKLPVSTTSRNDLRNSVFISVSPIEKSDGFHSKNSFYEESPLGYS